MDVGNHDLGEFVVNIGKARPKVIVASMALPKNLLHQERQFFGISARNQIKIYISDHFLELILLFSKMMLSILSIRLPRCVFWHLNPLKCGDTSSGGLWKELSQLFMAYKCCCLGYKHSKWNKTDFYILYKVSFLEKRKSKWNLYKCKQFSQSLGARNKTECKKTVWTHTHTCTYAHAPTNH